MISPSSLLSSMLFAAIVSGADACNRSERLMALTFDDLPLTRAQLGSEAMIATNRTILATLVKQGAPAIGFVNESKLYDAEGALDAGRVAALRLWTDSGNTLGNHGFSHRDLHRVGVDEWCEDVARGDRIIRPLITGSGGGNLYFRHPYLHTGMSEEIRTRSRACLEAQDLVVAPVSIDNGEWIYANAYDRLVDAGRDTGALVADYVAYMLRVVDYYEDQSCKLLDRLIPQVLLLHANRLNATALDDLLAALGARGYRFVTLDTALADPAYERDDEYFGSGGISWIHRWALTDGKRGEFFAGEPEVPESVQSIANGELTEAR